MKKRIVSMLLCASMAATLLTGCGGSGSSQAAGSTETKVNTEAQSSASGAASGDNIVTKTSHTQTV